MSRQRVIPPSVLRLTIGAYPMDPFGFHGIGHWARVLENGLDLAESTGASPLVVSLFAVLHDCRRWNESTDPEHGLRASLLVDDVRGMVPELSAEESELLRFACAYHADGQVHEDPTIGTCWDADRLDLARVGIQPRSALLCTAAARAPSRIKAATDRAVAQIVPDFVRGEWVEYLDQA